MKEKNFIDKKEIENYKKFAFKDDMLKMSVAFMLGASFNKVVTGISELLIMPFINFIIMQTGDSWRKWKIEPIENLKIEIGQFLGVLIDFVLISIILYIIYYKIISNLKKNYDDQKNNEKLIDTKICNFCMSEINLNAIKCPKCTGNLNVKRRRNRK